MKTERSTRGAWLLPATLVATVAQNYADLMSILSGEALALFAYEGPLALKILKDAIYVVLLIAVLWHAARSGRTPLRDLSWMFILLLGILMTVSAAQNGYVIAAIGLRWALPLLLFFLIGEWLKEFDFGRASRWLLAGLVLCLAAQAYQLAFMPPVFGEVFPGIPARTPGIFIAPNSAAFFACACAACMLSFRPDSRRLQIVSVLLAIGISGLAQSGTGIVTALILLLWWSLRGQRWIFWPVALMTIAIMVPSLNAITQRDDYLELSGGGRLEVLAHIASRSTLSLDGLGLHTNAANLMSNSPEDQVAVDSLVASWIGNFGVLAAPMLVLLTLFVVVRMSQLDLQRATPSLIVFGLFAMTTIVFEAFPMNIYLALGIWSACRTDAANGRLAGASR